MARGRRALSDEVKAAKGNKAARRRLIAAENAKSRSTDGKAKGSPALKIPDFVKGARHKEIYTRVVTEFAMRRIARPADLTAYARWAYYVDQWIKLKEKIGNRGLTYETKSKHGSMLREHPDFKAMLRVESVLQALEDRLGLNPVARQNIIRGLAAVPPAMRDLFNDEPQPEKPDSNDPAVPAKPESPLGFIEGPSTRQ